jgi:3-dehydroquinate synthetase
MLGAWQLPVRCPPFGSSAIWEAIRYDKKRRGSAVRWVLPSEIGKVEVVDSVPPHVVRRVVREMGAGGDG